MNPSKGSAWGRENEVIAGGVEALTGVMADLVVGGDGDGKQGHI